MTYYFCQNLLNITQVHWNQYRSCVPNGILSYNSYYTAVCCVNTVNSMWIFCMHGMPGLPATFAEIWCMHLKTLWDTVSQNTTRSMWRFIFKRVSELEAGNNYECYTCICTYIRTYTCKLLTIAVHLKTTSFVGHKLYINLYGTFPIKSNDVIFISEVDQKSSSKLS